MALTASPEIQARLLDLQKLDTALQQLAHRSRTLPERAAVTALQEDAERIKAAVVETSGHLEDARLELGRAESDVELVEKRIARDAERLQSSSSVKDIQGLEHELASLRTRLGDLEEIELAVMERIELLERAATARARPSRPTRPAARSPRRSSPPPSPGSTASAPTSTRSAPRSSPSCPPTSSRSTRSSASATARAPRTCAPACRARAA